MTPTTSNAFRLEGSGIRLVKPSLRDPRVTLLGALSSYTLFGQMILYFDISRTELAASLVTCSVLDVILTLLIRRRLEVPLSGMITGLSLGILLESNDLRVFVVASVWAIFSKYLFRVGKRHIFNPSNLAIVAALFLGHGTAVVASGSQWGNHLVFAVIILVLGTMLMYRVGRLSVVGGWLLAYVAMGLLRVAAGQGNLVFALGPMTGAEFALFSFSMLPDPKTTPADTRVAFMWAVTLGVVDGLLRLAGIKYSMFFALFGMCALRPLVESLPPVRRLLASR